MYHLVIFLCPSVELAGVKKSVIYNSNPRVFFFLLVQRIEIQPYLSALDQFLEYMMLRARPGEAVVFLYHRTRGDSAVGLSHREGLSSGVCWHERGLEQNNHMGRNIVLQRRI